MRALLDVNVIIALMDPEHAFHERAHVWWNSHAKAGWASCPITENGVVRILSNPGYHRELTFNPGDLIQRLRVFTNQSNHEFWPDNISLLNPAYFNAERIHTSRQITDLYLVALAHEHKGLFATFDKKIALNGVLGVAVDTIREI
jgi:toxin-antitoxin system PIN domain toxin